jgi:hypothetical protein
MRRLPYAVVGLLLMPLCHAVAMTLITLVAALRHTSAGEVSQGGWWALGGFLLWLVLFFLMPRPVKTYVLAHELTHAFWGLMMGAKVGRLRVGDRGGSVELSKTNFLITLAPYFFPFYTMLALALRAVLGLFYDLSLYEPFWLGLFGLTWSFHLTFTVVTLMQEQPDIAEHGRIFSYTLILLLNLLGACLWLVAAGSPTWRLFSGSLLREAIDSYGGCVDGLARIWLWVRKS